MIQTIRNSISILTLKEKKKLYLLVALNVIINILDIASLALLVYLISFYTKPGLQHIPYLPTALFNPDSVLLISLFLLFFILKSIVGYIIHHAQNSYVYSVASRISNDNLLHYLDGNYATYVQVDSAVHIREISHQPIEFAHYVLGGILLIATEATLSLLTIVAILWFNANLFLLLFAILFPPFILLSILSKRRLKDVRAHIKDVSERVLQKLKEALAGYVESNIYDRSQFFTSRYSEAQSQLNTYLSRLQSTQGISSRFIEVFAVFGLFILVLYSRLGHNAAAANITNIGAFIAAAYKIIPGIIRIANTSGQVKTYEFSVLSLLKQKRELQINGSAECEKIRSVAFENVTVTLNDHPVLSNLNAQLNQGEMIGISATSGKGKTTMINMLLGFVTPGSGKILINGVELSESGKRQLWPEVAYVKQQTFLINDTVFKNITLTDDEHDQNRLSEAIRISGLEQMLSKFPEGAEKQITENGKNISGGQRQRIAIARAIYKDASVMIFDEPFNELDQLAEFEILEKLKPLAARGKMIILVTHNKDAFAYCNKVISLDEE